MSRKLLFVGALATLAGCSTTTSADTTCDAAFTCPTGCTVTPPAPGAAACTCVPTSPDVSYTMLVQCTSNAQCCTGTCDLAQGICSSINAGTTTTTGTTATVTGASTVGATTVGATSGTTGHETTSGTTSAATTHGATTGTAAGTTTGTTGGVSATTGAETTSGTASTTTGATTSSTTGATTHGATTSGTASGTTGATHGTTGATTGSTTGGTTGHSTTAGTTSGTTGGTTGTTYAGGCTPGAYYDSELVGCADSTTCSCDQSCVDEVALGAQVCESNCTTTADCPDPTTVCSAGTCVLNTCDNLFAVCGVASVNGNDGFCLPYAFAGIGEVDMCTLNGTITTGNDCLGAFQASASKSFAIPASHNCASGLVCDPTVTTCALACDPTGSSGPTCPSGLSCTPQDPNVADVGDCQ